tara:strand:- start:404 stop:964 length:561 start_codon:yes stop_codon:yes gene_type:complete
MNRKYKLKKFLLKSISISWLSLMLLSLNASFAFSQEISLEELFSHSQDFGGKTITTSGEVIGHPLKEDKSVWVNITSGNFHLGIFVLDKNSLESIKYWGKHQQRGDIISAKGIFYDECLKHQISDLHLVSFEVLEQGAIIEDSVSPLKVSIAYTLSIICLTMSLIYLIKVRHDKSKAKSKTYAGKI